MGVDGAVGLHQDPNLAGNDLDGAFDHQIDVQLPCGPGPVDLVAGIADDARDGAHQQLARGRKPMDQRLGQRQGQILVRGRTPHFQRNHGQGRALGANLRRGEIGKGKRPEFGSQFDGGLGPLGPVLGETAHDQADELRGKLRAMEAGRLRIGGGDFVHQP